MRKLQTNMPDEHRIPRECGRCHAADLGLDGTETRQVAELERIVASCKNIMGRRRNRVAP